MLAVDEEPWWLAETVPPHLHALIVGLRAHFKAGPNDIGAKGDTNHLRGYHRSRAWVKNSPYCTNRTYSVTETPGNRSGGNANWLCAIDVGGMAQVELLAMCQRLDVAVRAGRLEKVTEWYGNLGGDDRVDGYNNIANRLASSDSSHLSHLHLSFDRGRVDEDHTDLLNILTGAEDMTPAESQKLTDIHYALFTADADVRPAKSDRMCSDGN